MPSHPGSQLQATAVPAFDTLILVDDERARPHDAHLPFEDVQQLRDLVQRTAAQEPADPRYPRVIDDLEQPLLRFVAIARRYAITSRFLKDARA